MTEHAGNEYDARYLALQVRTNQVVLENRVRMQAARDHLHDVLVDLTEQLDGTGSITPFPRPVVNIPLPPLDQTDSTPRRPPTRSGTRIAGITEIGVYSLSAKAT